MAHLPKIQAERQLEAIEAASVPHMEQKTRSRIFGRLKRRATGAKPMTAGEALATLPIPVVREPAPTDEGR